METGISTQHQTGCPQDVEDRIRELAREHHVVPMLADLFTYSSDAAAKLMGLALGGHVSPTRVASCGPRRQLWEFVIGGDLYLLSTRFGETEGFEPRDAGSFDRIVTCSMPGADVHRFVEAGVSVDPTPIAPDPDNTTASDTPMSKAA